jgi:hypothetical protein
MVLLCLCVVVQMLGVPATLLSPDGASDLLGASVLEGFSILPSVIDMVPSNEAETASASDHRSVSSSGPFDLRLIPRPGRNSRRTRTGHSVHSMSRHAGHAGVAFDSSAHFSLNRRGRGSGFSAR